MTMMTKQNNNNNTELYAVSLIVIYRIYLLPCYSFSSSFIQGLTLPALTEIVFRCVTNAMQRQICLLMSHVNQINLPNLERKQEQSKENMMRRRKTRLKENKCSNAIRIFFFFFTKIYIQNMFVCIKFGESV